MIELRAAFEQALRNILRWKNSYQSNEYPHKIVLNMMYRAYSTKIVYEMFTNDEMPEYDNFEEAVHEVIEFYGTTAKTEVLPYLEGWMANKPYEYVGPLCTARYEKLATKAETDKKFREELEFSYIFELLNDMCVLYYIAFRLSGYSQVDAISTMTNAIIEPLEQMDYKICKQVFQQLLVARYMSENYRPFI